MSLARPEGLVLGAALGAASLWRRPRPARADGLLPWAGLAAALVVLALQRALTGSWFGTSVSGKSLLTSYGPVEGLAIGAKYGVDVVRGLLLGLYPSEAPIGFWPGEAAFVFPPLGLLFVLLAVARAPEPARRAAGLWLTAVFLTFAVAGPNIYAGVHFNRYLIWAFPGLFAFAAAGLGLTTRLAAGSDDRLESALFRGAAGLFVVLAALSTARFAAYYAQSAGAVWRREVPMAEWMRRNLPPGTAIANASTSLEYLTGDRGLNLHGVVSPEFVGGRVLDREANVLEQMRTIPADRRPPYLLVSRSQLESSPLFRAFAGGPPIHETASLADDDLVLLPTRWEILDRGLEPVLPPARGTASSHQEIDRLDVGNPQDEAAHSYVVASRAGELPVGATVAIAPAADGEEPIADGGRLVLAGERFRVRNCRAGRDLLVVMRTRNPVALRFLRAGGATQTTVALPETALTLRAGGRVVVEARITGAEGWQEHVLRVPAADVAEGTTALELSGRYASYRFWFYQ